MGFNIVNIRYRRNRLLWSCSNGNILVGQRIQYRYMRLCGKYLVKLYDFVPFNNIKFENTHTAAYGFAAEISEREEGRNIGRPCPIEKWRWVSMVLRKIHKSPLLCKGHFPGSMDIASGTQRLLQISYVVS